MVKAMLGSQLVEGWIVSESAFKKLHKTLSRLMHPDVFDGRAADAEEAGNSELANRIRENKEKGSQFYARLNTIKSESLTGEGDEKESGLLNGMDDMNAAYPLAKLVDYMLRSTKFPGFYLNDLAYTLVMIDKELPKRFKIGPEKFKDFFAKDGVSLDFEYISEYYENILSINKYTPPIINGYLPMASNRSFLIDKRLIVEISFLNSRELIIFDTASLSCNSIP